MAGCFGNSKEDQYRERELDRYLDSLEDEPDHEFRVERSDVELNGDNDTWRVVRVNFEWEEGHRYEDETILAITESEKLAEILVEYLEEQE